MKPPSKLWILALALASSCALYGCKSTSRDVPTIWRQEFPSPDGAWVAVAHTEQDGGFGSAMIMTDVDLIRVDKTINRGRPRNILEFDCLGPAAHAYVLDAANAGGTIGLNLVWLSPHQLEATWQGQANLLFQVAQINDVIVSVRDLSHDAGQVTSPKR